MPGRTTPAHQPVKVAVTGALWTAAEDLARVLDRELRVHPHMTLIAPKHFVPRLRPWARANKVPLDYVNETNRYAANHLLVASGASEFLVFAKDRHTEHLRSCLAQAFPFPPVRVYG